MTTYGREQTGSQQDIKSGNLSMGRARYEGVIHGPDWNVVDADTGEMVYPGNQDFGHTHLGRAVISASGQRTRFNVLDYQHPAGSLNQGMSPEVIPKSYGVRLDKIDQDLLDKVTEIYYLVAHGKEKTVGKDGFYGITVEQMGFNDSENRFEFRTSQWRFGSKYSIHSKLEITYARDESSHRRIDVEGVPVVQFGIHLNLDPSDRNDETHSVAEKLTSEIQEMIAEYLLTNNIAEPIC